MKFASEWKDPWIISRLRSLLSHLRSLVLYGTGVEVISKDSNLSPDTDKYKLMGGDFVSDEELYE